MQKKCSLLVLSLPPRDYCRWRWQTYQVLVENVNITFLTKGEDTYIQQVLSRHSWPGNVSLFILDEFVVKRCTVQDATLQLLRNVCPQYSLFFLFKLLIWLTHHLAQSIGCGEEPPGLIFYRDINPDPRSAELETYIIVRIA